MKRKLIYLVMFLFLLSFVSAFVDYIEVDDTYIIDTIVPSWMGGDGNSKIELVYNTDNCLVDCEAIIKFTNEEPVVLYEGIEFKDSYAKDVRSQIKDLKFFVGKYEIVEKKNPIYLEVCENVVDSNFTNGSKYVCNYDYFGDEIYHVNELVWNNYLGTEEDGESFLKIKAKKSASKNVDWIITFRGEDLVNWAWWNANWNYKREITNLSSFISALYVLNHTTGMNNDFSDLRFIDASTESIELNYTIVNKTDGVNASVRLNNIGANSVYMYYGNVGASDNSNSSNVYYNPEFGYFFDNNNADDFSFNSNDAVINGATFTDGYISGAYDFDGNNDYADNNFNHGLNNNFSYFAWIKTTIGAQAFPQILHAQGSSASGGLETYALYNFNPYFVCGMRNSGGVTGRTAQSSVATYPMNTWTFVGCVYNGSHLGAWINGSLVSTASVSSSMATINGIVIGAAGNGVGTGNFYDGIIDEMYFYENVVLSEVRINELYNHTIPNFVVGAEEEVSGVLTSLINPGQGSNFTVASINFTFSSIPSMVNLTNATLYLWNESDGSLLLTNFTTLSGNVTVNTTFQNNLSDGNYKWNAESCAENVNCTFGASNFSFVVHTGLPDIIISNPSGTLDYFLLGDNESLNYSIFEFGENTSTHFNLCWFEYNNSQVLNNISYVPPGTYYEWLFNTSYSNVTDVRINQQSQVYEFNSVPSACSSRGNFSLLAQVLGGTTTIFCRDRQDSLNVISSYSNALSIVDSNITSMVKRPLNCSGNFSSFEYVLDDNTLCVHAIDEFGLHAENVTTWEYKLLEINQTYNEQVTEGSLETFLANIRLGTGLSIIEAILNYNSSASTGQSFISGGNNILRNSNFLIPSVNNDSNISFYWRVNLSDSSVYNLSSQNQSIFNLVVDNCTNGTVDIFNFSVVDEETQVILPDATIEIAVNFYDANRNTLVLNYSSLFEAINPLRICLNRNVSSSTSYSIDSIVRYEDSASANEYYNIVNFTFTNGTSRQDITLYDLNLSDSTEFQLTFTGSDFLPVEDALVYVDRQYINENTFKTVELPKTDYNGQTILHLVRNDVIYNLRIVKDNAVLGNFLNLIAFCKDFTIGDCTIELNAFDSVTSIFNYDEDLGIIFNAPTYNGTTDQISFNFVTSDGSAKSVRLEVSRNDIFGNRSLCNSTLLSSGGTLTCNIDPNLDESVLKTDIYVNDVLTLNDEVRLDSTNWGVGGYFVMFVMALSFVFMFSGSKTGVLVSIGLTLAGSIGLGIVSSELIGIGASGIWLLVIIIIGIYKLNQRGQN